MSGTDSEGIQIKGQKRAGSVGVEERKGQWMPYEAVHLLRCDVELESSRGGRGPLHGSWEMEL